MAFYALIIFIIWRFGKQINHYIDVIFGRELTQDEKDALMQQSSEFNYLKEKNKAMFKTLPLDIHQYKIIADRCQQMLAQTFTPWEELDTLLTNLSDNELLTVYIEFGTRLNTEGTGLTNVQGTLVQWILKAKNSSFYLFNEWYENIAKKFHRLDGETIDSKLLPLNW